MNLFQNILAYLYIITVFLLWPFLPMSLGMRPLLFASGIAALLATTQIYQHIKKRSRNSSPELFTLSLIASGFIATLFNSTNFNWSFILPIANYAIAIWILNNKQAQKAFEAIFWIYTSILFVFIFQGENPEYALDRFSQNGVSAHLLMIYFAFYASTFSTNTKSLRNLIMITTIVILSIWAQGRSSIFTSIILLGAVLYKRFIDSQNKKRFILISAMLIFFAALTLTPPINKVMPSPFQKVLNISYSTQKGFQSLRYEFWKDYLDTMDTQKIIFGNKTTNNPKLKKRYSKENYNHHNSFIRLHKYYGITGFLIILASIINLFIYLFRKKRADAIFHSITWASLFIRISTDEWFFQKNWDFILYIPIFYILLKYNSKKINHQEAKF